ncbi:WhiB family transcriptional regulator [Pseudonocardia sp. MH-G8]|uniref:WhiB family transcriptional regulator n=1 Tax=Pseudonocardia sp. MH-G8 TaxID=1854588 RepID=UPI000B9FF627|nr:WhiB family transcriptional regulator [Pseudonocardia sp. MH-G8]OZM82806.1 transcription factor WhiB [Pseudonocardia sp. MH-G8]
MTGRWNWRAAARCRTTDADGLFVTGARQREARGFCRACPVRTECLAHALDRRIEFGVWGGMTERERRALLRARPEVRSWYDLLHDARAAHYASSAEETADELAAVDEQEEEPDLHESA